MTCSCSASVTDYPASRLTCALVLQTFLKAVQQFVKEVQAGGPLAKGAKNEKGDAATAAPSVAKPSAAKKAEVRGSVCRVSCAHQHCATGHDARHREASLPGLKRSGR